MNMNELRRAYNGLTMTHDSKAPTAEEKKRLLSRADAVDEILNLCERQGLKKYGLTGETVEQLRARAERLRVEARRDRVRFYRPPSGKDKPAQIVGAGDTTKAALADAALRLGRT